MSEEQFLVRWSRRKQEAKADHAEATPEKAGDAREPLSSDRAAAEPDPSEVELSKLPSIESIDAATDITAFLRKGVPQELISAALRRAWSADPAIRDFVGLAENAWDFNDPNAMAGFGPLDYSAEQVDALVRRIVGGVVQTADSLPSPVAKAADEGARSAEQVGFASDPVRVTLEPRSADESTAAELPPDSAASQPAAPSEETSFLRHRTHGGALPR